MALSKKQQQAVRALNLNDQQGEELIKNLEERSAKRTRNPYDPTVIGPNPRKPEELRAQPVNRRVASADVRKALQRLEQNRAYLLEQRRQGINVDYELNEVASVRRDLIAQLDIAERNQNLRPDSREQIPGVGTQDRQTLNRGADAAVIGEEQSDIQNFSSEDNASRDRGPAAQYAPLGSKERPDLRTAEGINAYREILSNNPNIGRYGSKFVEGIIQESINEGVFDPIGENARNFDFGVSAGRRAKKDYKNIRGKGARREQYVREQYAPATQQEIDAIDRAGAASIPGNPTVAERRAYRAARNANPQGGYSNLDPIRVKGFGEREPAFQNEQGAVTIKEYLPSTAGDLKGEYSGIGAETRPREVEETKGRYLDPVQEIKLKLASGELSLDDPIEIPGATRNSSIRPAGFNEPRKRVGIREPRTATTNVLTVGQLLERLERNVSPRKQGLADRQVARETVERDQRLREGRYTEEDVNSIMARRQRREDAAEMSVRPGYKAKNPEDPDLTYALNEGKRIREERMMRLGLDVDSIDEDKTQLPSGRGRLTQKGSIAEEKANRRNSERKRAESDILLGMDTEFGDPFRRSQEQIRRDYGRALTEGDASYKYDQLQDTGFYDRPVAESGYYNPENLNLSADEFQSLSRGQQRALLSERGRADMPEGMSWRTTGLQDIGQLSPAKDQKGVDLGNAPLRPYQAREAVLGDLLDDRIQGPLVGLGAGVQGPSPSLNSVYVDARTGEYVSPSTASVDTTPVPGTPRQQDAASWVVNNITNPYNAGKQPRATQVSAFGRTDDEGNPMGLDFAQVPNDERVPAIFENPVGISGQLDELTNAFRKAGVQLDGQIRSSEDLAIASDAYLGMTGRNRPTTIIDAQGNRSTRALGVTDVMKELRFNPGAENTMNIAQALFTVDMARGNNANLAGKAAYADGRPMPQPGEYYPGLSEEANKKIREAGPGLTIGQKDIRDTKGITLASVYGSVARPVVGQSSSVSLQGLERGANKKIEEQVRARIRELQPGISNKDVGRHPLMNEFRGKQQQIAGLFRELDPEARISAEAERRFYGDNRAYAGGAVGASPVPVAGEFNDILESEILAGTRKGEIVREPREELAGLRRALGDEADRDSYDYVRDARAPQIGQVQGERAPVFYVGNEKFNNPESRKRLAIANVERKGGKDLPAIEFEKRVREEISNIEYDEAAIAGDVERLGLIKDKNGPGYYREQMAVNPVLARDPINAPVLIDGPGGGDAANRRIHSEAMGRVAGLQHMPPQGKPFGRAAGLPEPSSRPVSPDVSEFAGKIRQDGQYVQGINPDRQTYSTPTATIAPEKAQTAVERVIDPIQKETARRDTASSSLGETPNLNGSVSKQVRDMYRQDLDDRMRAQTMRNRRIGYGALGAGAIAGIGAMINGERERREEEAALGLGR